MDEQENTDLRREKRLQSFIFTGRFQKWFPNVQHGIVSTDYLFE